MPGGRTAEPVLSMGRATHFSRVSHPGPKSSNPGRSGVGAPSSLCPVRNRGGCLGAPYILVWQKTSPPCQTKTMPN
jgi:hypothetical protein